MSNCNLRVLGFSLFFSTEGRIQRARVELAVNDKGGKTTGLSDRMDVEISVIMLKVYDWKIYQLFSRYNSATSTVSGKTGQVILIYS